MLDYWKKLIIGVICVMGYLFSKNVNVMMIDIKVFIICGVFDFCIIIVSVVVWFIG